jgi:hypothetical protein
MDYYEKKYYKYKEKYMLLKQFKNNNNLDGGFLIYGTTGYWYTRISLGLKKLKDVPGSERTGSLCLTAIEKDPLELKYVPLDVDNYDDLCQIALNKNGLALEHVPLYKKSYNLYVIALKNNGLALQYVPFLQRTFELCEIAFKNKNYAIEFAPEQIQNQLKEKYNKKSGIIFSRTPPSLIS